LVSHTLPTTNEFRFNLISLPFAYVNSAKWNLCCVTLVLCLNLATLLGLSPRTFERYKVLHLMCD